MPEIGDHPGDWIRAGEEDYLRLVGRVPGFWPVDKPAGMTSRAVVDAVRRHLGGVKAGHTGTLDPPATGVLVVAVGRALRLLRHAESWSKEYEGTVLLGLRTDTWDAAGRVLMRRRPRVEPGRLREILGAMRGYVEQPTPPVSAARSGGKRLYELAREGRRLSPPRVVFIEAVEVLEYRPPRVRLRVLCGRGTYVRSIAHVLGERLGCGAVLEELRRLREGPFRLEHCLPVPLRRPG